MRLLSIDATAVRRRSQLQLDLLDEHEEGRGLVERSVVDICYDGSCRRELQASAMPTRRGVIWLEVSAEN